MEPVYSSDRLFAGQRYDSGQFQSCYRRKTSSIYHKTNKKSRKEAIRWKKLFMIDKFYKHILMFFIPPVLFVMYVVIYGLMLSVSAYICGI